MHQESEFCDFQLLEYVALWRFARMCEVWRRGSCQEFRKQRSARKGPQILNVLAVVGHADYIGR